jgi:pimeloyl-ACP methyl ester carboxylesterase
MAKAAVNGTTLEYVERGAGDAILFVHGSASDCRTWQEQLDAFARSYRAIAYSRRHHWPNAPIAEGEPYAMEQQADDLAAFIRVTGGAPVHLAGHSYGGFLGLLVALREPGLVRSLVLEEPPVVPLLASDPSSPSEILRLLFGRPRAALSLLRFGATGIGPATAAARRGDMEEAMRRFGKAVLGPRFYDRLSPARLEQIRANSIQAELLGPGFSPLDERALRRLATPTLLLTGEQSPRLFHHLADRLEELLPHAERIEIPGASHSVHEDGASSWNAAVLAFLAAQPSA